MITIRTERPQDAAAIYDLVQTAFATAEQRDGTEQDLVERLRRSSSFIPELALVAVDGDRIVGHILYTRLGVGDIPAVALAPLAVHPSYQRCGIGSMLMREGHIIAKRLGYALSVVLGSDYYYPRLGYRPASEWGVRAPFEVPDVNFMLLPLQDDLPRLDCVVVYDPAFFA